jgi:hypothetical protein
MVAHTCNPRCVEGRDERMEAQAQLGESKQDSISANKLGVVVHLSSILSTRRTEARGQNPEEKVRGPI